MKNYMNGRENWFACKNRNEEVMNKPRIFVQIYTLDNIIK